MSEPRNARAEAEAVAGLPALVLEPSPPAVTDEWFAEDATVSATRPFDGVSPFEGEATTTWSALADTDPAIAEFAADHWLANYRQLPSAVPSNYVAERDDFHRLAYGVVAEARRLATTKFGLRYTHGGFGTPFFDDDVQVRVQDAQLVVQRGDAVEVTPITTLQAMADLLGCQPGTDASEHDSPELGDVTRQLSVSADTNTFLGEWFGLSTSVMEQLRRLPGAEDVGRVQLWPGHFDVAVEVGNADAGQRATYGASPGDAGHDEPYLYVGAWGDVDRSNGFWNEENFNGASLPFATLVAADDQRAAAMAFFAEGHRLLTAS